MAKGLPTLIIQTLPLKGEVPTLLTCLLQDFLYKYCSRYGTANAYASGVTKWSCIRKDNFTVPMDAPQAHFITTVSFMVL
jgi:hypothetical protein